jgi:hypothetical protein
MKDDDIGCACSRHEGDVKNKTFQWKTEAGRQLGRSRLNI